jgi:hypothetical protein
LLLLVNNGCSFALTTLKNDRGLLMPILMRSSFGKLFSLFLSIQKYGFEKRKVLQNFRNKLQHSLILPMRNKDETGGNKSAGHLSRLSNNATSQYNRHQLQVPNLLQTSIRRMRDKECHTLCRPALQDGREDARLPAPRGLLRLCHQS